MAVCSRTRKWYRLICDSSCFGSTIGEIYSVANFKSLQILGFICTDFKRKLREVDIPTSFRILQATIDYQHSSIFLDFEAKNKFWTNALFPFGSVYCIYCAKYVHPQRFALRFYEYVITPLFLNVYSNYYTCFVCFYETSVQVKKL